MINKKYNIQIRLISEAICALIADSNIIFIVYSMRFKKCGALEEPCLKISSRNEH